MNNSGYTPQDSFVHTKFASQMFILTLCTIIRRWQRGSIVAIKPPPVMQATYLHRVKPQLLHLQSSSQICTWESNRGGPKCLDPNHPQGRSEQNSRLLAQPKLLKSEPTDERSMSHSRSFFQIDNFLIIFNEKLKKVTLIATKIQLQNSFTLQNKLQIPLITNQYNLYF